MFFYLFFFIISKNNFTKEKTMNIYGHILYIIIYMFIYMYSYERYV